jgi:hypothetical protein
LSAAPGERKESGAVLVGSPCPSAWLAVLYRVRQVMSGLSLQLKRYYYSSSKDTVSVCFLRSSILLPLLQENDMEQEQQ